MRLQFRDSRYKVIWLGSTEILVLDIKYYYLLGFKNACKLIVLLGYFNLFGFASIWLLSPVVTIR